METCYKVFRSEVIKSGSAEIESLRLRAGGDGQDCEARMASVKCPVPYTGGDYAEGKNIGAKDALVGRLDPVEERS